MARRLHPTHRVTILRRSDDAADAETEVSPTGGVIAADNDSRRSDVASGIPFAFDPQSTSWVREESAERVRRPASGIVMGNVDIEEGDVLALTDADGNDAGKLFVDGVNPTYDRRKEQVTSTTVELSDTK